MHSYMEEYSIFSSRTPGATTHVGSKLGGNIFLMDQSRFGLRSIPVLPPHLSCASRFHFALASNTSDYYPLFSGATFMIYLARAAISTKVPASRLGRAGILWRLRSLASFMIIRSGSRAFTVYTTCLDFILDHKLLGSRQTRATIAKSE